MTETLRIVGFNVAKALVVSASASGLLLSQPIRVVLTLDTSPGTEQAIGLLRPRAFAEADLVAVVTVSSGPPRLLLPLSEDRDALASALQRAGVRVGAGRGGILLNNNFTVDLAGAIKLACAQLTKRDDAPGPGPRSVVILLFGSTDPNLQSQMQTVKAALDSAGARLYAVQIDRAIEQRRNPLGVPPALPVPVLTAELVKELAESSGGRMYRRNWDLKEMLQDARKR